MTNPLNPDSLAKLEEEWRPVIGYEGYYEVSNLGSVRSLDRKTRTRGGKYRNVKGIVLKQSCDREGGYYRVGLKVKGIGETIYVHKLVAEAFIGPSNGKYVDHINRNKLVNRIDNLRYLTQQANIIAYHVAEKNSGLPYGVYKVSKSKTFAGRVLENGERKEIGRFYCPVEAGKSVIDYIKKNQPETYNQIKDILEGRG